MKYYKFHLVKQRANSIHSTSNESEGLTATREVSKSHVQICEERGSFHYNEEKGTLVGKGEVWSGKREEEGRGGRSGGH